MFLHKPEDIAYFDQIMNNNPNLEPYFAELAVWCWIYQRDKYLEIIKNYENEQQIKTLDKINNELENINIAQLETIQENNNI